MTGIDPRNETGHVETENSHAASGSGQKTATAPGASGHEKRAKRPMTGVDALDLLTANGKRSESENYCDVHESYSYVTWPSYPSLLLDPKIENHGRINTRWQDSEVTLEFPRCGTCGENWGERPKSEARKKDSTASGQLPLRPLPKEEKEKWERAPDDSPEAPPPLSLDLDRAGGEEAPQTKHQVHPETPPASPALLRGGKKKKKKKKSQEVKLPKKFPRVGKSAAQ